MKVVNKGESNKLKVKRLGEYVIQTKERRKEITQRETLQK